MCLVLEFLERGSLDDAFRDPSVAMAWDGLNLSVATDVARACAYLHGLEPPVIHRDLKSGNVMLTAAFVAKVGDMGISRRAGRQAVTMTLVGSPVTSAPEILRHEKYTLSADVVSTCPHS